MTKRALFVGRFQPWHNGHLSVIADVFKNHEDIEEIIIVIGSAEQSFSLDNPFTAGERLLMIRNSLKNKYFLDKFHIIPIRNINRYSIWVAHIESYCPQFEYIISNNSLVSELFEKSGYKILSVPLIDREIYSGTKIRQMMLSDDIKLEMCIPAEVKDLIGMWLGVERLKKLKKSDTMS